MPEKVNEALFGLVNEAFKTVVCVPPPSVRVTVNESALSERKIPVPKSISVEPLDSVDVTETSKYPYTNNPITKTTE